MDPEYDDKKLYEVSKSLHTVLMQIKAGEYKYENGQNIGITHMIIQDMFEKKGLTESYNKIRREFIDDGNTRSNGANLINFEYDPIPDFQKILKADLDRTSEFGTSDKIQTLDQCREFLDNFDNIMTTELQRRSRESRGLELVEKTKVERYINGKMSLGAFLKKCYELSPEYDDSKDFTTEKKLEIGLKFLTSEQDLISEQLNNSYSGDGDYFKSKLYESLKSLDLKKEAENLEKQEERKKFQVTSVRVSTNRQAQSYKNALQQTSSKKNIFSRAFDAVKSKAKKIFSRTKNSGRSR